MTMRELALHLLDIARNSIEAGASELELEVQEDPTANWLTFSLQDNGRGMDEATLRQASDPFFSTRTTRKQGLGLSLLKEACERCEGKLEITSAPGAGTTVRGRMRLSHIDRPPVGSMGGLIQALVCEVEQIRLRYRHVIGARSFFLDTEEIKQELEGGAVNSPAVLCWLEAWVEESLSELRAG